MTYKIYIVFGSLCMVALSALRNLAMITLLFWGSAVDAETYPLVGERVYSLPGSQQQAEEVSEPSIISSDQSDLSGIKDPILGRHISQKSVFSSGESLKLNVGSETVGNGQKSMGSNAKVPKVASAFVELKPMAITGRTTNPSLRFSVDERDLEPSDSVKSPKLIDRVYEDAIQIR
jgi:hypothetical protein